MRSRGCSAVSGGSPAQCAHGRSTRPRRLTGNARPAGAGSWPRRWHGRARRESDPGTPTKAVFKRTRDLRAGVRDRASEAVRSGEVKEQVELPVEVNRIAFDQRHLRADEHRSSRRLGSSPPARSLSTTRLQPRRHVVGRGTRFGDGTAATRPQPLEKVSGDLNGRCRSDP